MLSILQTQFIDSGLACLFAERLMRRLQCANALALDQKLGKRKGKVLNHTNAVRPTLENRRVEWFLYKKTITTSLSRMLTCFTLIENQNIYVDDKAKIFQREKSLRACN